MRIKKLTLEYFVSVRKAVLNFDDLDAGVFIISGRTGSGKSTIFDGIHYALYGTASNHNRGVRKTLISDFMPDSQVMKVILEFEQRDQNYTITRTLNKKGTATVQLRLPNGLILDKVNQVGEMIQDVVGLTGSQFDQLAMLEQGDFSKFLLATSSERGALLRDVFNTEIFQKVTDYFNSKAADLEAKVTELTNHERFLLEGKTRDQLADSAADNEHEMTFIQGRQEELFKQAQELQGMLVARQVYEEKAQQWKQAQKELAILDKQKPEYDEAVLARDLYQKFHAVGNLLAEKNRLEKEMQTKERAIRECDDELNALPPVAAEGYTVLLNKCIQEKSSWVHAGDAILERSRLTESITATKEKIQQLAALLEELDTGDLETNRDALQKSIKEREEYDSQTLAYDAASAKAVQLAQERDQLQISIQEAEEAAKDTAISFLLQHSPDKCPICGNPLDSCIDVHEGADADFSLLGRLQERLENIEAQIQEALKVQRPAACSLPTIGDLYAQYNAVVETIKTQEDKKLSANNDLMFCRANLEELNNRLSAIPEVSCDYQEVQEKIAAISDKISELYRQESERTELIRNRSAIDERRRFAVETLEAVRESYSKVLADPLASDFDEYLKQEPLILKYEMNREFFTALITAYDSKYMMYRSVQEPTAPGSESCFQLNSELSQKQAELDNCKNRYAICQAKKDRLEEVLREIDDVMQRRAEAVQIFRKYDYMAKQCSGKNDAKLSLENFVLHRQLEWILQNSNKFLAELTDNQYQLQLSWESVSGRRQGGLELSVLDTTRNTVRPSQTFSGGELFMLSLSLSLGLMVSINSVFTAANLDMLYLDEGFGTLDSITLNRCLHLIQNLKSIRTVGIISHVQDLIEAIPQGFLVDKGLQGSVITAFKR